MVWSRLSSHLLLSSTTGEVIELEVPKPENFDSKESYLNDQLKSRSFTIKMMEFQKPKIDENDIQFILEDKVVQEVVEWEPAPISSAVYLNDDEGKFLCSVEGQYSGYYYICYFGEDRPREAIPSTEFNTPFFSKTADDQFLICGTDAGQVFIRSLANLNM
jgi:hypothetical protein